MLNFLYNPGSFYNFAEKSHNILKQIIIYMIIGSLLYSWFVAPNDYQQGITVKIMYVHVPAAWLAMFIYALMTIYSILSF